MPNIENVSDATLAIECDPMRGSGFHFLQPDIVITNQHVIESHKVSGAPIVGGTEKGERLDLELLSSSKDLDYAILKVLNSVPSSRHVLFPKVVESFDRGTEVLFSGFPHGIPHLLVQGAIIAGLIEEDVFYIDGSVNGGNSGGPIIDVKDGKVIGIVTQRRFLGSQDLQALSKSAEELRDYCEVIATRGSVEIMGIDFGQFSSLMAKAMLLIGEVLEANANTGIGIGFSSKFVIRACEELGITDDSLAS